MNEKKNQISEKVKPHPLVISLLTQVEDVIPKWKIVPTKDVIDAAFKDPVKREKVRDSIEPRKTLRCITYISIFSSLKKLLQQAEAEQVTSTVDMQNLGNSVDRKIEMTFFKKKLALR
jgi:hypothetical protein